MFSPSGLEFQDFGVARNYEVGRPRYPVSVAQAIVDAHIASSGPKELVFAEPGAGTGLLTDIFFDWDAAQAEITGSHIIETYYASDISPEMLAGMQRQPHLDAPLTENRLQIQTARIQDMYAPQGQVDVIVTGQTKHWETRTAENEVSVAKTLSMLAPGGSEFAVYNAPLNQDSSFTAKLNALLEQMCPDPYYQAMTSGDPGRFLGNDAKSNLAKYFNTLAQRGNGEIFYQTFHNPTTYTVDEIKAYVFSNAFVKNAITQAPEKEAILISELRDLFAHYADLSGKVQYGNTTVVFGVVGLNTGLKSEPLLPTEPLGVTNMQIPLKNTL